MAMRTVEHISGTERRSAVAQDMRARWIICAHDSMRLDGSAASAAGLSLQSPGPGRRPVGAHADARDDLRPGIARELQRPVPPPTITWLDGDSVSIVPHGRHAGPSGIAGRCRLGTDDAALRRRRAWKPLSRRLPGMTREEARLLTRSGDLTLNPAKTAALLDIADDLYVYDFSPQHAHPSDDGDRARNRRPTFSPDGRRVAFVRSNNLFVVDIATRTRQALTTRRQSADPERPARLAVSGGDLRARPLSRVLVESRFDASSPSCGSTSVRSPNTPSSITCRTGRRSKSPTIPRPAIPILSSRSASRAPQAAPTRWVRSRRVYKDAETSDRERRLDAGFTLGRAPGPEP